MGSTRNVLLSVMLLVALVITCTGCNGFVVNKDMAPQIDQMAQIAGEQLPAASTSTIPETDARQAIKANALYFQSLADNKTINGFAYWFGKKKLLVNVEYAGLLDRIAIQAQNDADKADTDGKDMLNALLVRHYTIMVKIRDAKDGKK